MSRSLSAPSLTSGAACRPVADLKSPGLAGHQVAEQLAPVVHWPIGRPQRRRPFVAAHDELEETTGSGVREPSHTEVVNDQQRDGCEFDVACRIDAMPARPSSRRRVQDRRARLYRPQHDLFRVHGELGHVDLDVVLQFRIRFSKRSPRTKYIALPNELLTTAKVDSNRHSRCLPFELDAADRRRRATRGRAGGGPGWMRAPAAGGGAARAWWRRVL